MLSGLDFETAGTPPAAAPNRADVACFVGYVGRRPGTTLGSAERAYLRERGWEGGPWGIEEGRIESLLHLPVVVESWAAFDRLFAWEDRPLHAGGRDRCATYMGAALRSFFQWGGRRAVVVRAGDPWPYLGGDDRDEERDARLTALVPARALDRGDPGSWRGVEHLYGLDDVSHVCLPDLADVFAVEPPPPVTAAPPPPPPEVFVECSGPEAPPLEDGALRTVSEPRLAMGDADSGAGYHGWIGAVRSVLSLLSAHRRDALLLASLPLVERGPGGAGPGRGEPADEVLRRLDLLAAVEESTALTGPPGSVRTDSALLQLVWPWLRTTRSDDLPGRLEPGDGLMAGILATNALGRGTFRSVAGTRLPGVVEVRPLPDAGLGPESPTASLARRVCLIGPEPDGLYVLSDVTASSDRSWRPGGVSRLMATLLRAARRTGEAEMFEPNGAELWARIRTGLESLLDGFYRAGALRGADRSVAFRVRCDRSTMSQRDLDHGVVRAEVSILPAAPVDRITVSLALATGRAGAPLAEVV